MAEAAAANPRSRSRTFFYVAGALVLLVAIAVAAALLLIRNKQLARFESYAMADATSAEAEPHAEPDRGPHVFATLDMFTANLADTDRERFAQIAVVIELSDEKANAAFKSVSPIVRSEILLLLSAKSAAELLTLEGKQALAKQIVDLCRKYVPADYRKSVHAAHFSSFVIQ